VRLNKIFDIKHRPLLSLVVVGLTALPQQASANAGTPLMWAEMLHLAIGNALIGLLEGFLLVWLFRLPRAKAVGAMIAATTRRPGWEDCLSVAPLSLRYRWTSTMVGFGSGSWSW